MNVLRVSAVMGALVLATSCAAGTQRVAVGQTVRQDDFLYTVVSARRGRPAHGVGPIVVSLEIENRAGRVGYRFAPGMAFLSDAGGRRYPPDVAHSSPSRRIEAGADGVVRLTYFVPASAAGFTLGYTNGVLMGDVFDGLRYARERVVLGF